MSSLVGLRCPSRKLAIRLAPLQTCLRPLPFDVMHLARTEPGSLAVIVEVFRPRLISIRRELLSATNSRNVKGDDSTEGSSPLALSHGCRDGRSSNRSWSKI
jgi:hypothetical protein